MNIPALPVPPTRFTFFTGKGGVGKTSHACAASVALADAGRRVLLVSTDPASNLSEVLGVTVTDVPVAVPGAPGLWAVNVDPGAAAGAYRERALAPVRASLAPDELRAAEEQLAGACTVEVAAFDAFSELVADEGRIAAYDHVVFDTAPTGHTLRLLALPAAWSHFLGENPRGAGCLGPLGVQPGQRSRYAAVVAALADPARTTVVRVGSDSAATTAA